MSLGIFLHIVEDYRCCREVDDFSSGEVVQIGATVSASVPIACYSQEHSQQFTSSLIYIQMQGNISIYNVFGILIPNTLCIPKSWG